MALEPRQTFRLVPRGGPGLTCDSEGVALGGIPVTWSGDDGGASRWLVRSPDEIGELLERAYGPQRTGVADRFHRGLRCVAAQLEAGDLALAAMEALMLRLPTIDAEGMAKLATGDLWKGGDAWQDEPRVPAGQPEGRQWTTGGASAESTAEDQDRPRRPDRASGRTTAPEATRDQSRTAADDGSAEIPEIVVPAPVAQSRRQSANGFYVNSTGGGVFFIPTTAGGPQVRPTEVHAKDANALQVSWDENGVINLKDTKGTTVKVPVTTPEEVRTFNATTGRAVGVAIYTFPGTPLGSPDSPSSPEEERELAEARAAWLAGRQASEQSWSGRVTTGAVLVATALPFLALAPVAAEAPVEGPLNTARELWPITKEVLVSGANATARGDAYETGVQELYSETALESSEFDVLENGKLVTREADQAAKVFGKDTAIEAKYVDNWSSSLRNPNSPIGGAPFSVEGQQNVVSQAVRYDQEFEGGSVYHTNSYDFATHYYNAFKEAGVSNFRFVITPATH